MQLTPEEEQLIDQIVDTSLSNLTKQYSDEEITKTVHDMWVLAFNKTPEVRIFDSPKECKLQSDSSDVNFVEFWSHWCLSYANVYTFGKEIGIEMNEERASLFTRWATQCAFILMSEDLVYVSRNPTFINFEDGVLSNDSGPSIAFNDGYEIYSIRGVGLTEQIVMNPETLTINQINNERNEEIRRIMIERYGSGKYLHEVGAEIIDGPYDNWIEGTKEYLFKTSENEVYLLCACPSTGKEFYLEVNPEVTTCQEAQMSMSNGLSSRIISAS